MVSVIIPCHNVEGFLGECLDSVLHQTWKDLEVICVDDGSTDGSAQVLEKFSSRFPDRVKVIAQKNAGASAARNAGLSMAKGEYIQFLDADDLLMPEKIAHQMKLAKNGPDLIIAPYERLYKDKKKAVIRPLEENAWMGLMTSRLGCTCSNLWKASALKKVKGWDEDAPSSQEYDLMFRLMQIDSVICFDDSCLTLVRERKSGSISQVNQKKSWERYVLLRARIISFLDETGKLTDKVSRSAFYQVLFDAIRIFARFDREKAFGFYGRFIPADFKPVTTQTTRRIHLFLHSLLGFRSAEVCIAAFRKLIP